MSHSTGRTLNQLHSTTHTGMDAGRQLQKACQRVEAKSERDNRRTFLLGQGANGSFSCPWTLSTYQVSQAKGTVEPSFVSTNLEDNEDEYSIKCTAVAMYGGATIT